MKGVITIIVLSCLLLIGSAKSVYAWELLGLHQVSETDAASRMSVLFGLMPPCTAVLYKEGLPVATGGDEFPFLCSEWQLFHNYLLSAGIYRVIMTDSLGVSYTSTEYMLDQSMITPFPSSTPSPTRVLTPTIQPTSIPTPTTTPTLLPTMTPSIVPTQVVEKKITSLSPLKIWLSLQDPTDLLVKFDIRAEVYKGSALISSGQKDSIPAPLSLFGAHGAKLIAIPFASFSPITDVDGSVLQLKTFVRNACKKSLRNSGSAKIWFNDKEEDSQFGVVINKKKSDYFLRDNFILSQTQGSSLKTITVSTEDKCGIFKPFGTWRVRL
jgi:hypothetical protein